MMMKDFFNKSWMIARFKGVEIRLHITMLLVVPAVFYLFRPEGLPGWLFSLVLMIGLLFSVFLHEIGHTIVAQRLGIPVKQIVIWPLGGFTHFSRTPEKPVHKFLINAAGPLVSMLLTLLLGAGWLTSLFLVTLWDAVDYNLAEFIYRFALSLALLNGFLVIFNLLPIYPLDGGDMLNALVERFFGKSAASTVSIVVGIPFLFGLILLGLFTRDFILLAFCILLAISIGTLNPYSRQWILKGINYLVKRTGYHHLNQDYDAAIQGHTAALEKNPKDVSHMLGRAIACLGLAEKQRAIADIESILTLDPDHAVALELRGEMHAQAKEYDAAMGYYVRVKALKPDLALPYFDCGSIYLEKKQFDQALGELNRAIALQAQHPLFFLARSMVYYRMQNLEAAHQDQAEAIRLAPQSSLVMNDVNLNVYEGYLDWAQDYYGWVLAKNPRQALAYQGRADAYAVNGQPVAAILDYTRALALSPKDEMLHLKRGLAYKSSGQITLAGNDFRQVLTLTRKSHLRRRAEQLLAENEE